MKNLVMMDKQMTCQNSICNEIVLKANKTSTKYEIQLKAIFNAYSN